MAMQARNCQRVRPTAESVKNGTCLKFRGAAGALPINFDTAFHGQGGYKRAVATADSIFNAYNTGKKLF